MKYLTRGMNIFLPLSILAFVLLPFIWMVISSLKNTREINSLPVTWFPTSPTFDAYRQVWFNRGLSNDWIQYFYNTALVTITVTIIVVLIGILMGYSLTRLNNKWVPRFISIFILVQLFNGPALILPIYSIVNGLGLYNTLSGYILVLILFEIPFAILLSQNFIRTIPKDLDEAAKIDG